jgi:hypothetical protein
MSEYWCLWELMGDTDGKTRGGMRDAIAAWRQPGWDLAVELATVGSDGWWPHSMALWRITDDAALTRALDAGFDDGLDEHSFHAGRSTLFERISGELVDRHAALLVEHVRAESAGALDRLAGPDAVFAEIFAPWQGLAIWGADDIFALGAREREGMGCGGTPGLADVLGSWAIKTPSRDLV